MCCKKSRINYPYEAKLMWRVCPHAFWYHCERKVHINSDPESGVEIDVLSERGGIRN